MAVSTMRSWQRYKVVRRQHGYTAFRRVVLRLPLRIVRRWQEEPDNDDSRGGAAFQGPSRSAVRAFYDSLPSGGSEESKLMRTLGSRGLTM
jgi:hypothetical protein